MVLEIRQFFKVYNSKQFYDVYLISELLETETFDYFFTSQLGLSLVTIKHKKFHATINLH